MYFAISQAASELRQRPSLTWLQFNYNFSTISNNSGAHINSPPSSQLTCIFLQTYGFPIFILFEVLFPASTGLFASSENSVGAIGLGDGSIPISVRRCAHICGFSAQSPHCLPVVQTEHEPAWSFWIQLKHPGFDAFRWQWQTLTCSTQHILCYFYKCLVWCGL